MSREIERIGVVLMQGALPALTVRSTGGLVQVSARDGTNRVVVEMTVYEAKAWRAGLSRAIRQADQHPHTGEETLR